MNLASVMIGSSEPKRLADYYTALFGTPMWDEGGFVGWQLGTGAVAVGPHDEVTGTNPQPGRVIWNIEVADVKSEFDRLTEAGATVVREPYQPAGPESEMWIATFSDPDGNYFQLMSPM